MKIATSDRNEKNKMDNSVSGRVLVALLPARNASCGVLDATGTVAVLFSASHMEVNNSASLELRTIVDEGWIKTPAESWKACMFVISHMSITKYPLMYPPTPLSQMLEGI